MQPPTPSHRLGDLEQVTYLLGPHGSQLDAGDNRAALLRLQEQNVSGEPPAPLRPCPPWPSPLSFPSSPSLSSSYFSCPLSLLPEPRVPVGKAHWGPDPTPTHAHSRAPSGIRAGSLQGAWTCSPRALPSLTPAAASGSHHVLEGSTWATPFSPPASPPAAVPAPASSFLTPPSPPPHSPHAAGGEPPGDLAAHLEEPKEREPVTTLPARLRHWAALSWREPLPAQNRSRAPGSRVPGLPRGSPSGWLRPRARQ